MEQVVTISSGAVHYWTYGQPTKPCIVMIHGFTGDHYGFQKIIPFLEQDYRIIVPDLPGSGISSLQGRENWTIDGLASLANEFVKSLALPTLPIIFGHSMGGLVVASMVHQAPALYSKVILLSPVPSKVGLFDSRFIGAKLGELQYWVGHRIPVLGPKLVKSSWLTHQIAGMLITTKNHQLVDFTHEQMLNNLRYISSLEYYYQLERDINKRGALDYAAALSAKPLLVINGDTDRVVPLKKLEPFITASHAEFMLIEGVGHDAHYERPGEVAAAVKEFLQ